jgi:hypothetical protein
MKRLSLGDFLLLNSLWEIRNVAQYALNWQPKKWTSMTTEELWRDIFFQTFSSIFLTKVKRIQIKLTLIAESQPSNRKKEKKKKR